MVLVIKLSEGPDKHKIWYTQDKLDLFKADMTSYIKMVRLCISKRHTPTASNILGMEKFLTVKLSEEYLFLEQDQETEQSHDLQQQSIKHHQVYCQFNATPSYRQWMRRASMQETKRWSRMTPSSFEADIASMENSSHPMFMRTVPPSHSSCQKGKDRLTGD